MDSGIQSSFIPRDAASATPVPRLRSGGGLAEVGLLVSIILLVASAALAGAVFLYGQYVQTSEDSKVEQLQRAKAAFEPSLIAQLTRLDDRMRAADIILGSHIAPTEFFAALQQSTLATVAFQTLDFQAGDTQRMSIKMSGIAEAVNSIALQADLFSKNGVITNPIFSDISRQTDGVHFSLNAVVNPAAINFVRNLDASSSALPTQAPANPFGTGTTTSATPTQQGTQPYPATQTAQ